MNLTSIDGQRERRTILYTRVSTEDQAAHGNSLRDQEARLREYCERTGRTVVAHYQDDASAKTFNRPQFQALLRFLEDNRGFANELLVVKWDRFSRDMTRSLNMINQLADLGVTMQAAEQPVDLSVPEQRIMAAVYLASPEVENLRRSQNAKVGMRRAMREGRWCNKPPIGYMRAYDERGRATIAPTEKAELVREAFRLAADTSMALEEIRRRLGKRGLKLSRSRFYPFLQNPVYRGRIRIDAWREEPEEEVMGHFEAIVPPSLFERVQEVRFPKRKSERTSRYGEPRLELVLRGHLACPKCSKAEPSLVTGSLSRGKLGRLYPYYHCHHCSGYRVRAEDAHEALHEYFRELQLAPEVAGLYRSVVRDMVNRSTRERNCEEKRL